jgi:polar amino acid transport system substrate-binding protein
LAALVVMAAVSAGCATAGMGTADAGGSAASSATGAAGGSGDAAGSSELPASATDSSSAADSGTGTSPSAAGTETSQSSVAHTAESAPSTAVSTSPIPTAVGAPALPLPECRAAQLKTVVPSVLTVGTTVVPDAPWFDSTDPSDGQGLDPAVIAKVAATLGYSPEQVRWRVNTGTAALGDKSVDLVIGRLQIPDRVDPAMDFSTGYYDLGIAVMAPSGTKAAAVTTVSGLTGMKIAAASNSDAVTTLSSAKLPAASVVRFSSQSDAIDGPTRGQADAVALPAWQAVAAAKDGSWKVLGVLPTGTAQPRQLGIALAHGSPLTACISAAVDANRAQGGLAALSTTWIGDIPTLG